MKKTNEKTIKYLTEEEHPIFENNIIQVNIDKSCEMAEVLLNDEVVMCGNFWDFHNDCHGMKMADFRGYNSLVSELESALKDYGKNVEIFTDKNWKYDD